MKSNVGHLNSAAGIAGLFKAIWHSSIKRSRQLFTMNHPIRRSVSKIHPFFVNQKAIVLEGSRWSEKERELAFFRYRPGTNAHMIIEEGLQTKKNQLLIKSVTSCLICKNRYCFSGNDERLKQYVISILKSRLKILLIHYVKRKQFHTEKRSYSRLLMNGSRQNNETSVFRSKK
ncbi:hypothetical protein ACEQPO_05065 [Bacillus sp. SL00103]